MAEAVLGNPAFGFCIAPAVAAFETCLIRLRTILALITATMSLTLFKLSKPGGPTRRLTFPNKPSWSLLASKIESLYGIPFSKVGVSYIDNDGDEVTLSSEDELNDFYEVSYIAPQPIKFTVQDLRSLRESGSSRPLPETPRASGNLRNTFGGLFVIDDDWQLPGLTTMFRPSDSMTPDSPHAYLEMVESDMTRTDDKASSIGSDLVDINPNSPEDHQDKGKGKSYEPSIADTISSTGSVLAEDAPPKHPLHVYDMSSHGHDTKPNLIPINQGSDSSRSTVVNAPTGNTSKAANIEPPSAAEGARLDPVAPSLGTPAQTFEHPSISNDFATLLNAFTNVVSSHPELSEAARNIMLNVASGAYWKHHRETISRGAEEILRTAQEETGKTANDIRRTAEEEAGKRVSAALDAIMRAFSDMGGHGGESAAAASPVAPTTENAPDSQPTEAAGKNSDPLPPPPPPSVPFKPWHPWHHPPSGPPHSTEWYRASPSRPWLMPHPPPHVPPPGFGHVRPLFPPLHPGPPPLGFGHPPPFAPPPQSFTNRPSSWISDPNPQDLKAKVELAKLKYKTEKEHYRAHRAHRKEMQRRQLNQTNDR